MKKHGWALLLGLLALTARAEFSDCRTLSQYKGGPVAAYKAGFITRQDRQFVYFDAKGDKVLFEEFLTGSHLSVTPDDRYLISDSLMSGRVDIYDFSTRKVKSVDLGQGASHGTYAYVRGALFGFSPGGAFKVDLSSGKVTRKPYDYQKHYWISTWVLNGQVYMVATNPSKQEIASLVPLADDLTLGEPVESVRVAPTQSDAAFTKYVDDSGYLLAFAGSTVQVIDVVNRKPVFQLDRYGSAHYNVTPQGFLIDVTKYSDLLGLGVYDRSGSLVQRIADYQALRGIARDGKSFVMQAKDGGYHLYCQK